MGDCEKLKKISKCLTPDAAETIALRLVISQLDFATALYSCPPSTEISIIVLITMNTEHGSQDYNWI